MGFTQDLLLEVFGWQGQKVSLEWVVHLPLDRVLMTGFNLSSWVPSSSLPMGVCVVTAASVLLDIPIWFLPFCHVTEVSVSFKTLFPFGEGIRKDWGVIQFGPILMPGSGP